MERVNFTDTIAAISTGLTCAGIGIVRISGKDALRIADEIFVSVNGRKASSFPSHTIHYGKIVDGKEVLDEVLLNLMRAPKTYTREDVVEINSHGSPVVLRKILELVLRRGARLAKPGEFTQRAFLNGRIDLSQAEAVLDIIQARSDAALKLSLKQLRGELSKEINRCRNILLEILANLEAAIDFPDDEIEINLDALHKEALKAKDILAKLLESSQVGKTLREGLYLVICGKPNVGKSSILNALVKKERAIVSPVAGTTRDTIEEIIDIKGIPVRIVDTAGILEPRDLISKKAVERSRKEILKADLILMVFDASKKLSKQDYLLIRRINDKKVIAVINKIDLKKKIDEKKIYSYFDEVVELSAKKMRNIKALEEKIAELVFSAKVYPLESVLVSNLRHIELMRKAQKNIASFIELIDNKISVEFLAQEIKEALAGLDELLGKTFSPDLLDKIFSNFCIGK